MHRLSEEEKLATVIRGAMTRLFNVTSQERKNGIDRAHAAKLVDMARRLMATVAETHRTSAGKREFLVALGGGGPRNCRCRAHPIASLVELNVEDVLTSSNVTPTDLPRTGIHGVIRSIAEAEVEDLVSENDQCMLCGDKDAKEVLKRFHSFQPRLYAFLASNGVIGPCQAAMLLFGSPLSEHDLVGCKICSLYASSVGTTRDITIAIRDRLRRPIAK